MLGATEACQNRVQEAQISANATARLKVRQAAQLARFLPLAKGGGGFFHAVAARIVGV